MTKHANKLGHSLSKALAAKNRASDALQSILVAAEQLPLLMLSEEQCEEERENLPDTPLDSPVELKENPLRKKRIPVGLNGWEDGFKLIRGVYWIRVQRRGKRKCINLRTNSIRIARERKEALAKDLVENKYFGAKFNLTVSQLWDRYAAVALVRITPQTFESTRRVWENHILPHIGDMLCIEVNNEVVEQLLALMLGLYSAADRRNAKADEESSKRKKKHSKELDESAESELRPERGNRLIQAIKVVFYWGLEAGLLDMMPFTNSKVPVQEVVRPYVSLREIPKFIEEGMKDSDDPEARELQICMGLFLGLRSSEIRLAKRSSFDMHTHSFAPDQTKTRKTRRIYVPSFLMAKVSAYLQSREIGPNDYLFTRDGSKRPFGPGFLRNAILKAAQAIGKPALTPHRMRTSFATLHAIAGTPIRVIQQMLGHKCIQTTLIYIEDVPELNQIAQARLETLVGFGDVAGVGIHRMQPWDKEIGALLGNLAPVMQSEPTLAAAPLMELMNALRAQLQQVEATLATLQNPQS